MNSPRPLASLLRNQTNVTLDGMLQHCRHLQQLEQRLADCLDMQTLMHCRLTNIHQGVLLLGVDSSAWASRLRYQLPDLLLCARRKTGLEDLQSIQLSVLPRQPESPSPARYSPPVLSRESALTLCGCASGIKHESLRQALERLANRAAVERKPER